MAPADDSDGAARSDAAASGAPGDAAPLSGADERFGFTGVGLVADDAGAELPPGTVLGDVTIVRRIAAGGMGCVYEGRQHAPDRPVAVKVMHRGMLTGGLLRRFAAEAGILARLKHPHIAQIHSFGTHRDPLGPLPYFVMELVADGRPLTRFAADRGLDPRQRVALFEQVCGAVAHGHQRGVVHRDLKPGNILVDSGGEPKVIDFGVARATDADRAGTTTTGSGVVGTLRYMSPEQLGIGGDGVDTRSDVYALGLVLHELLLGDLPYDLGGRSPVAAAALLAGRQGTPAADVERRLLARGGLPRREAARLATIVAHCLHVDPARRYGTAVELRAELGRWLAGEPLVVKPPTLVESLGRFAARHRAATAAVAATALALAVAMTAIGWFSLRAERQRQAAEAARAVAEARGAEAERRAADARRELHRSRVLLAAAARERGAVAEARRLLDAAREAEPEAARSIEIACLAADLDGSVAALAAGGGAVTAVGWSADGRMLAAGTAQGDVRCWRWPALDAPSPVWSGRHEGEVWGAAFAPDGTRLATVSADGTVRIWSAAGAPDRVLAGHDGPVYGVAWSPAGDRLATTGRDGTVRVWDAGTGTEAGRFSAAGGTVFAAAFAPDGTHLASGSRDGVVRIWDVGSGTLRDELRGHAGRVFALVYAADGTLASASEDGTVRVWDAAAAEPRLVLRHPLRVNGVAFTAAGESLVTAAGDGVLRTWDAADGDETARLVGHEGACWSVAAQPQGMLVASGAADGSVRVWNLDPQAAPWRRESERVTALVRLPGRRLLAVATADGRVRLRHADTLREHSVLAAAGGSGVRALACSPDGGTLAVAADDGGVTLWDVARGRVSGTRRPHERRIYAVAFSPCGRRLLTAAEDRTARLTDVAGDEAIAPPLRHPRRVLGAAWSPDGARVATACEDRLVRLWDAETGALLAEWPGHTGPVNWVAFSADGGRVASAASDASVRIWDAAGREPPRVLTGPARQVWKVAFAPDGTRVAAAAADGTVPIWEAADGQPVATLRGHADQVWAVDFAPDGRSLVTGAWDGCVRLWGVSAREIARREAGAGDETWETAPDAAAWNQFRGPSADGSTGADLPLEWSEERHVRWKTPLPGKAWSSPVAADGRIWLSNATEDGRRLSAVCVAAADGRILHDVTVFEIAAPAICDPYNSHASPTPVLVEGRLFVHFGSAGTACLDAATGAVLWRRQDLPCNHHRGPGSSPIPWRDRLFVNFDGFDRQYVVALARDDGRTLWRTDRDIDYGSDDGDMKKAYGTPALVEHDGRVDLVSPAAVATVAYDPETGIERWKAYHGGYNAAARPLFAAGLVIVTTAGGDNVVAIRPGGSGDVTRTHVAWKFRKSAPTRPSQAVVGDHLYLVSDNGVFSCVALADGAVAWQQRRSGRHSASPVRSGDRLYWCDEDGTTVVTRANPERFELLAENRLEAGCMASPAVVGTDLVLRTKTHLYRIGSAER